jgi:hypothetical protein
MSRVGRTVLDSNRILDNSDRQKNLSKPSIVTDEPSKENVSVNLGNDGISFVIE